MASYKHKKVMSIGIVNELTGLSLRQIRYYEERRLIQPERTKRGTRKYSFSDVETLLQIADKREEGVQTYEIRKDLQTSTKGNLKERMIRGQLNAHFQMNK
ncbi:MerR family transcriptional regulator [Halobacillus karajensis]|uniref:HTH-type transcriptional regulator TnrA n=1 Tax=Halobacillus karajensis TaxID=195088 RepID=A0A024P5C8_9BACI|nr:MerR family transcriptional regulator [Halobacillus karajensis]CDQ20543.1 HTH-type transcriptional regulator TnrA [Halobacillus karajensis]CDQ23988.1 HTH-type transcriptional regulator TnrA [Halobacillus karajensis]CDQ27466.1 HTH-type transcriptional regulator TnrA [Halobacillus karajensis]